MDSRRFGPQYRSRDYALERTTEVYATYYDVKYPGHERQAGRPLRVPPAYQRLAGPRRRVRRERGLGAGQLVRVQRGGRRRVAAPRRLGRTALVAGDRRRAPRLSRGGGAVRRDLLRQARGRRAGRGGLPRAHVREPGRPAAGHDHLHPAAATRAGGVECDLTVTRLAEDRFRIVTGTAFGQPRPRLAPLARARGRLGASRGRDLAVRLLRAVGTERARRSCSRSPRPTSPIDEFPYLRARELSVGAVPCLALRVTFVGELGWELYCPTEFALRSGTRSSAAGRRPRPGTRRVQGDRVAAAREGLPRLGQRRHLGRHAVRGGTRFRGANGQRGPLHRARRAPGGGRRRRAGSRAWCSTTPAPSCSARSRCGSTAAPSGA